MKLFRPINNKLLQSVLVIAATLLVAGCKTTSTSSDPEPMAEPTAITVPAQQQTLPVEAPPVAVSEPPEVVTVPVADPEQVAEPEPVVPAVRVVPAFRAYTPGQELTGRLRSAGSDTMDTLMANWEAEFLNKHPRLSIRHEAKGSSTAIPALMEGRSDFGSMSRPLKASEVEKFTAKFGYGPMQLRVAVDALAVYIHPSNPLAQSGLSLQQLDAIFSSTRLRGGREDIVTWGQLGITDEWLNAPINIYGRNTASGTYGIFKDIVLGKGDYKSTNQELAGSAEVIAAVAGDKYGIGYSGIGYKTSSVATLPIAISGKLYVEANKENTFAGKYALGRFLYLTIHLDPKGEVDPLQREFLKFVYSEQGQQIVEQEGYFAITNQIANQELRRIGIEVD